MAATSATGATAIAYKLIAAQSSHVHLSKNLPVISNLRTSSAYLDAAKQCITRRIVLVRNSTDESSGVAATTEPEPGTPVAVEVQEGPPSIISALNVEKALRGIAITDADHYGRLGLQTGCSYDQVTSAYKNKVTQMMNQGLPEDELSKELELLKESYSILSSGPERRLYDWSLARYAKPERYMWPHEVDITQVEFEATPPPGQEPEDVGPTRLVGYFILSWFILSIGLFIVLNG